MNQNFLRLLFFFFLVNSASANNILVQNLTTTDNDALNKTIQVQFDMSWDNSWRDAINWDAAQTIAYLWSNGATTPSIDVNPLETTKYFVTISQNGVDYLDSLVVSINQPTAAINGDSIICLGSSTILQASGGVSYFWSTGETTSSIDVSPEINTTYWVYVYDANGCFSSAQINVVVNQPSQLTQYITTCGSFTWKGNTYNQSGTYTWTGTNFAGCDYVDTLNLTIFENTTSTIEVNSCGPYEWNGVVYSKSGAYTHLNSCASQTLLLHINEIIEVNAQINSGETYDFNGIGFSETGVYYDTIPRLVNCDSIVRLNLYVNPPINCEIVLSDDSLCSGEVINLSIVSDLMVYTLRPNNIEFSYGAQYQWYTPELRGRVNSSNPYNLQLSTGVLMGIQSMPDFNNFILISDPTSSGGYYDGSGLEFIAYFNNINTLNIDSTYYYRAFIISGNDTILAPNQHTFFVRNETLNPMLDYGELIDIEENRYKTITIGSQTWMAENLMTNHYSNGESLENEMSLYFIGGGNGQYNHPEIYDQRNICPLGTHVPNDSDWVKLFNYTFKNEPYVIDNVNNPLSDTAYVWSLPSPQGAGPLQSNNKDSWNWTYRTNSSGFSSTAEDPYNNNYWSSSIVESFTVPYVLPFDIPYNSNPTFPFFNQVLFAPGGVAVNLNYVAGNSFNEIRCISNEEITEDKFPTIESAQSLSVSSNSASFHVDIENGTNAELLEKGMIISTFTSINGLTIGILPDKDDTPFPLIDDYKILQFGSNPSDFNVDINNLMPSGKYYVRAYVKNKYGIRYGEELTISTPGNSILWSTGEVSQSINVYPTQTTSYSVTVNQGGQSCTSDLTITVNQPSLVSESVSTCQPYTWNDSTYTESGTYTWSGINAAGCDSLVTLNLTINPNPTISFSPDNTTFCNNSGSIDLIGGIPLGGVYSGAGVSNGSFNPATAGSGLHPITYTYTDANGCSNSSIAVFEVSVCTGVETFAQPELEVRPNPMESSTFVSLKNYVGSDSNFNLLLMDATGRKVFEKRISVEVIREGYLLNIPDLASGTYLLMLNNSNYTAVKRLVK